MAIEISGAVTSKIGFASHQNAVPVLRELELTNNSAEVYEDLELSISFGYVLNQVVVGSG